MGLEANREKTIMKLKHIDLEAIGHFGLIVGYLGGLWGAILGILGPT